MSETTTSEKGRFGWKLTLLVCGMILLLGAGATTFIFFTEPTAKRSGATKETAMLVGVTEVRRGTYRPTIVAMGTVEPMRDIILRPRVGGEIVERAESFSPGGFAAKGEVLLRIDPADYQTLLQQRRSELRQANADLSLEMGQQEVARQDYELHDDSLSAEREALVLREPQLNAIQARVESAEAAVEQAELDLERTRVKAPFDARVLARNANVGSQVSPGDGLGRLVGFERYWLATSVPLSKLPWISFADGDREAGSRVRVRNRTAWPPGQFRTGYLDKLVGALDSETRMAQVLVSVPDPLGRESGSSDAPRLIIGAFLEARIEGREIADVVRLDRGYVRQGDTVWVMEEGELRIREVEIVFRDAEHAFIVEGLNDGDRVVTTNLATVVEGSRLRLGPADAPAAEEEGPGENSNAEENESEETPAR